MIAGVLHAQNDYWNGPWNTTDPIERRGHVGINLPGGAFPLTQLHIDGNFRFDDPLSFSVQTGPDRFIHNAGVLTNTFTGFRSGINSGSAEFNAFFGYTSGLNNLFGNNNTFMGNRSGFNNEVGSSNTFVGSQSGEWSNSGESNVAVGHLTFQDNVTGSLNTALGYSALRNNGAGINNVAIGARAAQNLTDIDEMIVIGSEALNSAAQDFHSIYIGTQVSRISNNSNENVMVGHRSAFNSSITEANTFIGNYTGYSMDEQVQGTFVGHSAGYDAIDGYNNTYIGTYSGQNIETGSGNTMIGIQSGSISSNVQSELNTLLGAYTHVSNGISYSSALGVHSQVCDDHTMVLGNYTGGSGTATTVVIGDCEAQNAGPGDFEVRQDIWADNYFTFPSDKRLKMNIKVIENPLEIIKEVKGYNYQLKKESDKEERAGLIAQELLDVFPYAVKEGKNGYYGVNYTTIIPLLLQGINEQQDTISSLKDELSDLRQEVDEIKQELGMNNKSSLPSNSTQNSDLTGKLQQNAPNPFSEETVINYQIEGEYSRAVITLMDFEGKQIKDYRIVEPMGEIRFNGSGYPSGIYFYGLFVDNELLDIKKMIIAK